MFIYYFNFFHLVEVPWGYIEGLSVVNFSPLSTKKKKKKKNLLYYYFFLKIITWHYGGRGNLYVEIKKFK